MPALASMTEEGLALLESMPAFMYDDPHTRAVCHVWSMEAARMNEALEAVRDGLIPTKAGAQMMEAWEGELHLPRNPDGVTLEDRRLAVLARLQGIVSDPSGALWISRLRQQIGTGWTYEEDPVDEFLLRFTVPWPSGSEQFLRAQRVIEEERPAAWDFLIGDEDGFNLDVSSMDTEPLGR